MMERILTDVQHACPEMSVTLLRYFNPIGAHESGKLGEDPNGIPNNLMPLILRTAAGKMATLSVFGNDYPTPDGTCVRDYIHVVDLALGHVAAIKAARAHTGCPAYNLGTGKGYSVLEIINAFEKVNKVKVPYVITGRRPGDAAACYSNPALAKKKLGWTAKRGLEQMCRDSWNYIKANS